MQTTSTLLTALHLPSIYASVPAIYSSSSTTSRNEWILLQLNVPIAQHAGFLSRSREPTALAVASSESDKTRLYYYMSDLVGIPYVRIGHETNAVVKVRFV